MNSGQRTAPGHPVAAGAHRVKRRLLGQIMTLRRLLGHVEGPTLIVADELDFICGPAQARPIASAVTGSRLVLLPGCGHIPTIEAPEEYRHAVLEFLRQ
jgi:pimeloyl-ACP methyl ester carboxylesterase